MTVEVRLKLSDVAQGAVSNDLSQGQEVRIPSTILVDCEQFPSASGYLNQLSSLCSGRDERLLHDNVFAGLKCCLAHFEMGFGNTGDDDNVDGRIPIDVID